MMDYPLSLALLDFVPVFLTGIGFIYLLRLVSSVLPAQGRIAFLGGMLVIAGGFFKAVWKLLMALSNSAMDINWMEDALFVFMAPGYVLFTWSIWQISRSVQGKRIFHVWIIPSILNFVILAISYYLWGSRPDSLAWERILLSVTVLSNLISGILLIVFAFRQKLATAGWLFIANLIGVFLLNGLARLSEQPIALQWIEEGINAVSWLSFSIAAWTTYQHAREHFGVDAAPVRRLPTTTD